jgi:hypothetical protein
MIELWPVGMGWYFFVAQRIMVVEIKTREFSSSFFGIFFSTSGLVFTFVQVGVIVRDIVCILGFVIPPEEFVVVGDRTMGGREFCWLLVLIGEIGET